MRMKMSDTDSVTVGRCDVLHKQSKDQLDRVEMKLDRLEKRLFVDNGTKSVQTRLNENSNAIVEINKKLDSSKTRHGDQRERADSDENCSDFAVGPFKWTVQGKAGTQMFISTGWRVFALILIAYIAHGVYSNRELAEVNNAAAVKAVKASTAAVDLLQQLTGFPAQDNPAVSNEVN